MCYFNKGSMSLELAKMYPDLKFIVQDTEATVAQAREIWQAEHIDYLQTRVTLMAHDFFKENPVKGAEAYVLRCVLCVSYCRSTMFARF